MLKSLFIFVSLFSIHTFALPLQLTADGYSFAAANYNFNGIAKTKNCSASVVKFRGQSEDSKALLLTNGHCLGMGSKVVMGYRMPAPGEVLYRVKTNVVIDLLNDSGQGNVGSAYATELIYGTMTDTDMAIFRLEYSYRDLKSKFKVGSFVLSDRPAIVGSPIQILSGYWRRGYSCHVDTYVHLLREDVWTFKNSLRYSEQGCDIIGGTSGSPVISENTGEVVAVNNTINQDGGKCSLNNPCEVNERGSVSVQVKGGYAQHTVWLYSCLDSRGELDLNVRGCQLPKPTR